MRRYWALYKTDLIQKVAEKTSLPTSQVKEMLQSLLEAMTEALKGGDKVTLVGFGTLSIQERAARRGTDPNTGKLIEIPKRKTVRFKAGSDLTKAVDPKRKPVKQKKTRAKARKRK
jgi:DNA-binding protein HU-beta